MRLAREFIDEIRARTDIVALISADVHLTRCGKLWRGCSPFRDETHPSFFVYPHNRSWYDFGARVGGDAIRYLEIKRRDKFMVAVEKLAELASLPMPDRSAEQWSADVERIQAQRRIHNLLTLAASYYHSRLTPELRQEFFIKQYGFTDETIDSLRLGWADGSLWQHFRDEGIAYDDALATGLFSRRDSGPVDFFRNRLIFPYWANGSAVYFIARRTPLTGDSEFEVAKYKKLLTHSDRHPYVSPHVSNSHFYGEDSALDSDSILITEGVTDCISAYQADIACISPVTTRFRNADIPHLLELVPVGKRVVICNDNEASGRGEAGALETAAALWKEGRDVRLATIPRPEGEAKVDLNEYAKTHTPTEMRDLINAAATYPEYLLGQIPTDTPAPDLEARLSPVLAAIATAPPLVVDHLVDQIAHRFSRTKRSVRAALKHVLESLPDAPKDKPVSDPPPENPERPTIVDSTDPTAIVPAAEQALVRADTYARNGHLVFVSRRADSVKKERYHIAITTLSPSVVQLRLALTSTWLSPTNDPIHPPLRICNQLVGKAEWQHVPRLVGVTECPTMRPDGTILDVPGYDAETGLFFHCDHPTAFLPTPEEPTIEDARSGRALLESLVQDFPFASPAGKSAWCAGVLTSCCRYAFDGPSPLFLCDANTRGTGKGLLAKAAVLIGTGRDLPGGTMGRSDDEQRKKITSIVMSGEPIVLIDNIERPLGGENLDSALTATTWSDRELGTNRIVTLPMMSVWWATGNNVELVGDMSRRIAHIRLQSPLENPEDRTDFHEEKLLAHVLDRRAEYLRAALTILRAYHVAGRPRVAIKPWGSFEGWSELVRASLVWCGAPDPADTRSDLAERADTASEALRALLPALAEAYPAGFTAAELVRDLSAHADDIMAPWQAITTSIAELCPTRGGRPPTTAGLGRALTRHNQTRKSGLHLEQRRVAGLRRWSVVSESDDEVI